MTIESDTLATLVRIENLLKKSTGVVDREDVSERRRVKVAGGKKDETSSLQDLSKAVFRATKRLDDLGQRAEKLGNTMDGARGDLVSLRSGIRSTSAMTTASLSSLNTAVAGVVDSMGTLSPSPTATEELSASLAATTEAARGVRSEFLVLVRMTKVLNTTFDRLAQTVVKSVLPSDERRVESSDAVTEASRTHASTLEDESKKQGVFGSFFGGMLSRMGIQLKDTGDKSEWVKMQLTNFGWALSDALISITKDVYNLQARGISAGDSLFSLYGKAIKAGMSLEEYTSMLDENAAAVVRARSFDDFQESLNRSVKSLNALGVFGPAANQLAASLATSAVTLGIPQSQLADSTAAQVKVFEQLRKTTLMTADGFKELVNTISSNQNVQEELLGMAPAERRARQNELILSGSLGQQMGLTQEASRNLTEALLAQRKASAQSRFMASGLVRQAGAMTGMGSAETEELARLARRKSTGQMTDEERKRFVELSGNLESRLQTMMNSGNVQAEFLAEQMAEKLDSTSFGNLMKAAGQAKLQTESGTPQNAETGQGTSKLTQDIGNALTTLSGFMKNPLADAMVILGSMLVQSGIQVFWLARIHNALVAKSMVPDLMGPAKPTLKQAPTQRVGIEFNKGLSKVTGGIKTATKMLVGMPVKAIVGASKSIFGVFGGIKNSMQMLGPVTGIVTEMAGGMSGGWDLLKTAVGGIKSIFMKGGPLSAVFGFFEELFTGEMTSALGFGEGFGARLMGAVVGGINSFFTGFTRLIDGGINWVMEGLGLSFRSNLTKVFDYATLLMVDGWRMIGSFFAQGWELFKAGLYDSIATILDAIPGVSSDAPWVKGLRESAKSARKDAEEESTERSKLMEDSAKRRTELWETEGATLRSIGENQIKAQKDIKDKSKGLTKATADNVVFGIDALAASAQRSVAAAQATAASPATTQVATPGPTKQSQVTPPEAVNKTQVEEDKKEKAAEKKADAAPSQSELLTVAQLQLDVLRQMLAFWMSKEDVEDVLGRIQNRPTMESGSVLFNRALGR